MPTDPDYRCPCDAALSRRPLLLEYCDREGAGSGGLLLVVRAEAGRPTAPYTVIATLPMAWWPSMWATAFAASARG